MLSDHMTIPLENEGSADEATKYMYYGKLGEKAFKQVLLNSNIDFLEDTSGPDQADEYDFLVKGFKIDVKTRTKRFHKKTLEMVKQFKERSKDVYVGAYYNEQKEEVDLYGYIRADKLAELPEPESNGYEENYWVYDNEMEPLIRLIEGLKVVKTKK